MNQPSYLGLGINRVCVDKRHKHRWPGTHIMFTYTSLFLVSPLVAIVARVNLYKRVSEATGLVYNTVLT
jgi:hypothetical protein